MNYADGSAFNVKVTDIYGNPVGSMNCMRFTMESKTYYADCDLKGNAKLKISNAPGKYKITVSCGDTVIVKNIRIGHAPVLKSVKVKKSAKKLTLTASLKKVNGNT